MLPLHALYDLVPLSAPGPAEISIAAVHNWVLTFSSYSSISTRNQLTLTMQDLHTSLNNLLSFPLSLSNHQHHRLPQSEALSQPNVHQAMSEYPPSFVQTTSKSACKFLFQTTHNGLTILQTSFNNSKKELCSRRNSLSLRFQQLPSASPVGRSFEKATTGAPDPCSATSARGQRISLERTSTFQLF